MGTQQILMIILSVIVVGAAIAVGIQMFDTQATNQTRNALVVESMQMGVQAQAFYRTPKMMGGAGFRTKNATTNDWKTGQLALYINKDTTSDDTGKQMTPDFNGEIFYLHLDAIGEFTLTLKDDTNLHIYATDGQSVHVNTTVQLPGSGKTGIAVYPNGNDSEYTPPTPTTPPPTP